MGKKFNGHRCERRNLTDLVLGTGPDGKKRAKPKAKKRPKNYTTEPAANQMFDGGPTQAMFDLDKAIAESPELQAMLEADPGMYDRLTALNPGQVGDFLTQKLGKQGKANLISAGGQAAGNFISNMGDNASDPTSKYGVQEGIGAAISGATNPLAMTFGPAGMAVGAAIGLGKSIIGHNKEKEEFLAAEEEAKESRIRGNVQSAQDFSRQVLSTYNQDGMGGGFYARHGGPLAKFFNGGPSNDGNPSNPPVASAFGMDLNAFNALQERLNPELYNAVQNMPPAEPDRLYNYTDAELARNERIYRAKLDQESLDSAKETFGNVVQYHIDSPMDALGMDLAVIGQVPGIGEPFDLANAAISTARSGYYGMVGDTAKAKEQAIFAGLSGASAIPFAGNVSGAARLAKGADTIATGVNVGKALHHVAHGAHNLEKGVIAAKGVKAATHEGYKMGGPVDYETEKSEVILASPNDPPVAVGQGSYKQISGNLYKANGPSHEMGGVPTRGATQPFIDNTGKYEDSPYVFSDAKEMRFDASNILNMIR